MNRTKHYTYKECRRIAVLEKRRDWLAKRIAANPSRRRSEQRHEQR